MTRILVGDLRCVPGLWYIDIIKQSLDNDERTDDESKDGKVDNDDVDWYLGANRGSLVKVYFRYTNTRDGTYYHRDGVILWLDGNPAKDLAKR